MNRAVEQRTTPQPVLLTRWHYVSTDVREAGSSLQEQGRSEAKEAIYAWIYGVFMRGSSVLPAQSSAKWDRSL